MDSEALSRIRERRLQYAKELYQQDPTAFEQRRRKRLAHLQQLSESNPALAAAYQTVYQDVLSLPHQEEPPL